MWMELAPLFSRHTLIRGVIESALEGRLGRVLTDDAARPAVARIDIGCYSIFGGPAAHPVAARLVKEAPAPIELIVADDQEWRDLLVATHGSRLEDRPMRTFATHALDAGRLEPFAAAPDGFSVAALDAPLAEQLDDDLHPHGMQVFPTVAEFLERGFGFGVVHDGRLVSASTSYTISSKHVEVSISTHPDYRGRGLARVAAASLIRHCLDVGLIPDWSASNPVSKRLALSLGYQPGPMCDIFFLS